MLPFYLKIKPRLQTRWHASATFSAGNKELGLPELLPLVPLKVQMQEAAQRLKTGFVMLISLRFANQYYKLFATSLANSCFFSNLIIVQCFSFPAIATQWTSMAHFKN